ncbi:MAG: nicotinamide-nucleotide amidohydrolase family protein [Treponema sp.]|jgi:PncC family amidohydrolase|nr:nicotinamide-nucleotide amidohydrolase family protein [Treponema sp.]
MDKQLAGEEIGGIAALLIGTLKSNSKILAAAESCTAGLAADLLARVPGASQVFWGSFVTYTIDAKAKMLGLDAGMIGRYGAVSRETACAMAKGALLRSGADYAFSITGLAGPLGDGTPVKIGTVWIGLISKGREAAAKEFYFSLSRNELRLSAANKALEEMLNLVLKENR